MADNYTSADLNLLSQDEKNQLVQLRKQKGDDAARTKMYELIGAKKTKSQPGAVSPGPNVGMPPPKPASPVPSTASAGENSTIPTFRKPFEQSRIDQLLAAGYSRNEIDLMSQSYVREGTDGVARKKKEIDDGKKNVKPMETESGKAWTGKAGQPLNKATLDSLVASGYTSAEAQEISGAWVSGGKDAVVAKKAEIDKRKKEAGEKTENAPVTEGAKDFGFSDATTKKLEDEASLNRSRTEQLVGIQETTNKKFFAEYDKMTEAMKSATKEAIDKITANQADTEKAYKDMMAMVKRVYATEKEAVAGRQASQSEGAQRRVSGAGISGSALRNAVARIANDPSFAAERQAIETNYVNNINATVKNYDELLNSMAKDKLKMTSEEQTFYKDIQAKKVELEKLVNDIKTEGVKAVMDPVIKAASTVRESAVEAETKTKKDVYEQREYEGQSSDVRMKTLLDSLYQFSDTFDRSKIPLEDLRKAAAMSSFSEAKQYLANVVAKIEQAERDKELSASTGGGSSGSANPVADALKGFSVGGEGNSDGVAGKGPTFTAERKKQIDKNIAEGFKNSPAAFASREAFIKAYAEGKSGNELKYVMSILANLEKAGKIGPRKTETPTPETPKPETSKPESGTKLIDLPEDITGIDHTKYRMSGTKAAGDFLTSGLRIGEQIHGNNPESVAKMLKEAIVRKNDFIKGGINQVLRLARNSSEAPGIIFPEIASQVKKIMETFYKTSYAIGQFDVGLSSQYANSVAPKLKKFYKAVIDYKNAYESGRKEAASQILNSINVNF